LSDYNALQQAGLATKGWSVSCLIKMLYNKMQRNKVYLFAILLLLFEHVQTDLISKEGLVEEGSVDVRLVEEGSVDVC
jgi:hypothetical protein